MADDYKTDFNLLNFHGNQEHSTANLKVEELDYEEIIKTNPHVVGGSCDYQNMDHKELLASVKNEELDDCEDIKMEMEINMEEVLQSKNKNLELGNVTGQLLNKDSNECADVKIEEIDCEEVVTRETEVIEEFYDFRYFDSKELQLSENKAGNAALGNVMDPLQNENNGTKEIHHQKICEEMNDLRFMMDSIAGPSASMDNLEESDVESDICTPEEIVQQVKQENLIPEKSRGRYNVQYQLFMDWCAAKNIKKYNESVILVYMSELSEKVKPSTLWSINSMLKATLLVKHDIDIGSYKRITAFLRKKSVGFIAKTSRTFTQQEIDKFLTEAPDETYLMMKVVLIIGIAGACRSQELTYMIIDDVTDKDDTLTIHIKNSTKYKERTFTVCNSEKEDSVNVMSLCKKYFSLRPKHSNSRRLFLKYAAGKCVNQNVGYNTINAIPSRIATYLNLSDCEKYSGRCYRRTSTAFLADSGVNLL